MEGITKERIEETKERIKEYVQETPLVKLNLNPEELPPNTEIYLKLENLQTIGSFKIRGASAKITSLFSPNSQITPPKGVWTSSAGNMAQGVCIMAKTLNIKAIIVVPETAPQAKLTAIRRLGGEIIITSFDNWWKTMETRSYIGLEEFVFIPAFDDEEVLLGNGTIVPEIKKQLNGREPNAILCPWGGGGLTCGVASSSPFYFDYYHHEYSTEDNKNINENSNNSDNNVGKNNSNNENLVEKKGVKVYATEVSTAAPLSAALSAMKPIRIETTKTFVDGIGSPSVFPHMFNRAKDLGISGSLVADPDEIAYAIKLMIERNHIVSEGAGASSVACAMAGRAGSGVIVCIVSGANINSDILSSILLNTSLPPSFPTPVNSS